MIDSAYNEYAVQMALMYVDREYNAYNEGLRDGMNK